MSNLFLNTGRWGPGRKTAAPRPGTKVSAATELVTLLAAAFPGRAIDVVADAAYHGPAIKHLPPAVTWTCRLRANAVLYDLSPPRAPAPKAGPGARATGWARPASWPPPPAGSPPRSGSTAVTRT